MSEGPVQIENVSIQEHADGPVLWHRILKALHVTCVCASAWRTEPRKNYAHEVCKVPYHLCHQTHFWFPLLDNDQLY